MNGDVTPGAIGRVRIEYLVRLVLLAFAYWLTGKFGQSIAIPPGYATVVWPPSGIALGALLAYGRRLWPAVFAGSLMINADIANLATPGVFTPDKLLLCVCIASGSTLQALTGHTLIARWFGLPLKLSRVSEVFRVFALAGPLACLVAATIGVSSLHFIGTLASGAVVPNWLAWWSGDVLGVVVFLPLMLALPGGDSVTWRDRALRGVHAIGLMLLVLPLGLTFYAWKFFDDSAQRQSRAHFEALARESEQAMYMRLGTYANATRGGAGVFQSSDHVSRAEWRRFTETIRLREDFPGLIGLGWIERVTEHDKQAFVARTRADAAPDFRIHPESDEPLHDVVTYMEPEVTSGATLGLDVSYEIRRRQAAETAAATGMPTLTRPIQLLQDEERTPGFLLLQPVYESDVPLDGALARRRALRGFVYAPFQARAFLANLTPSQAQGINISVTSAGDDPGEVIFGDRIARDPPKFSVRREMQLYGQSWLVTWQSTPEFEQAEYTNSAMFVLFGGLLFTGLFAVLLVVIGARRLAEDPRVPSDRPWALSALTFVLVTGASVAAYLILERAESVSLSSLVEAETRRIEGELERSSRQRLQSLRRMQHRWETGGGTPYLVWRNDARDYVRQIDGLEEMQWIGADYRVQWAEGVRRSGWTNGRDIRTDKVAHELAESFATGMPMVTEPHEVGPGESAFTVYIPLQRNGHFDGFLAGIFSSRGFFEHALDSSTSDNWAFSVKYANVTYFDNGRVPADNAAWRRESGFHVNDKRWSFTVAPTQTFVAAKRTRLPLFVFLTGLLIAVLAAILVRYVLLARLKAARVAESATALRASEERYALVMRGMSVGLWDWHVDTNAFYWSEKFRDILGPDAGVLEPNFREFSERLHPEDRTTVEAALFGHLRQQSPFDLEFRLRRHRGDYVWVHAYGQAKYNAAGHAERMAGSVQDITHKREQQRVIERSEAQMRMLVDNAPAAVAMFDREMRYLMASRRWHQDFGLEGRDVTGLCHYDVFPEIRSMPHWLDIHQRALHGERFEAREEAWARDNGRTEFMQWAIHPWLDAAGQVGGIVMFAEVITKRKQAEQALRVNEELLRAAMDKSPIGKALVSPHGRFLKVNPAFCQMLGYTEKDLLANDFQTITHPDDLGADLDHLRLLLEGKTVSYQMEKRYLHRDGRMIWAELSVSMVRKPNGECDFLVAQVQDITERKGIERIQDEFASVVSHELRSPLTSVRASLNMISTMPDVQLPAPVRRLVDVSQANTERMIELVNDILDLDQLELGQMRFELADAALAPVTQQAVQAAAALAHKLDVRIALEYIDPSIVVYVDAERYRQVLANLLSNAAKFSPSNSEIEVGAELRGDTVRVFVRDHGDGIPEEFRARIFGKFARAEAGAARQSGGTGLGLHITRQLVEHMNGTIGFVSQTGLGTTFWVEFPCVSPNKHRMRVS